MAQLRKGLQHILQQIPLLSWQVIPSKEGGGRLEIVGDGDGDAQLETIWKVKDLTGVEGISIQKLRDEKYPM